MASTRFGDNGLALAEMFTEPGVIWFEEPVSSDDLEGLRLIRDRAPVGMETAAGEYGYDLWYFRHMLEAGAVDVLQADVTRCAGITGFLRIGALVEAHSLPLSILDDLRNAAEQYHLTFGPDPATHNHCTLGGMIGNNSCGVHALMAGKTADNIEELDILTYDGLRMRVGRTRSLPSQSHHEDAR